MKLDDKYFAKFLDFQKFSDRCKNQGLKHEYKKMPMGRGTKLLVYAKESTWGYYYLVYSKALFGNKRDIDRYIEDALQQRLQLPKNSDEDIYTIPIPIMQPQIHETQIYRGNSLTQPNSNVEHQFFNRLFKIKCIKQVYGSRIKGLTIRR